MDMQHKRVFLVERLPQRDGRFQRSVSLWYEKWDNNGTKEIQYPCLLSFAKHEKITMHEATDIEDIYDLFHLPLSIEAIKNSGICNWN
jgi:hypothetical protein